MKNIIIISLILVSISSCASTPQKNPEKIILDNERVECSLPRPQVCTFIYQPVCGELLDGTSKTHSSGCTACSDANIVAYLPGSCQ